MFLFGTVKYNTIIENAWVVVTLYATNPFGKNTAHKNHCVNLHCMHTQLRVFAWGWNLVFDSYALFFLP